MADAAPATPAGTSSTPASPTPEGQGTPAAAAPATDATQTTPTSTPTPATSPAAVAPVATQDATPLFTIPETVKLAPEATKKFESFLRTKLGSDGKVTLTSQEVLDQFLEQALDANVRWEKQVADKDKANEAACKERFTPAQLSAAETAVGFFSSFDPQTRDFAKRQLNDPVFVNMMRIIGERLSEDTFEVAGNPPPAQIKRSAAEIMGYAKKPN